MKQKAESIFGSKKIVGKLRRQNFAIKVHNWGISYWRPLDTHQNLRKLWCVSAYAFENHETCVQVSLLDIDAGCLFCGGLICSSHSQVSGHCQQVLNWWNLTIQSNWNSGLWTRQILWDHTSLSRFADLPFNLVSCFLAEFLKRWKFSGFAAHCFTDKHATLHNAIRSSGIPESAKLSEPRFGCDTRHPETELGPKSTFCQRRICPGLLRVEGESVGGTCEGGSCCHPSSWRSARKKDQIINEVSIFLQSFDDVE